MIYNIYYESLEQGIFYVKNNILKIDSHADIKLVKKRQQSIRSSGFSSYYSVLMSKILLRKNPDIIISTIIKGEEIPIVVIEFSTAVFTKDHEQQRADNFLVPINNTCIYIKISPTKKDSGNHGGDTNYNYLEPFSLCLKRFNELTFHFNWDVDESKKRVSKHEDFKSLPSNSDEFHKIFQLIYKALLHTPNKNWKSTFFSLIQENLFFKKWFDSLKSLDNFEDIKNINSSRTHFDSFNEKLKIKKLFTLKINRMGHAMDPERGMLVYYSNFLCSEETTVMAKFLFNPTKKTWYKDTPKEKEIYDQISGRDKLNKLDLITFLVKGLSLFNGKDLIDLVTNSKDQFIFIDHYIDKNYDRLNNSFRTIIDHSSILEITDGRENEIFLRWTPQNRDFELTSLEKNTRLKKRRTLSEDDVTYITIHNVFKENKIEVLSISYPGAQSDTPILPEPEMGRMQKRIYIDSIGKKNNILVFQENKGLFQRKEISSDVEKIEKFKYDENYKKSIVRFVDENNLNTDELIIGVGFAESKNMLNYLNDVGLDKIDYFLIIDKTRENWKIFSNNDYNVFIKKSGKINFPESFEVEDFKI